MTLILTRVDPQNGIVMVTDSALTDLRTKGVVTNVQKLFVIPELKIAMSCWGRATIPCNESVKRMDEWMEDFIDYARVTCSNSEDVAEMLRKQLNTDIPECNSDKEVVGVHVAGVSKGGDIDFWHVHNGISQEDSTADPKVVTAHHHIELFTKNGNRGGIIRNGDFIRYAIVAQAIDEAIETLQRNPEKQQRMTIPANPNDIYQWKDYLLLHLDFTTNLWKLSDQPFSIARPFSCVIIDHSGIVFFQDRDRDRTGECRG